MNNLASIICKHDCALIEHKPHRVSIYIYRCLQNFSQFCYWLSGTSSISSESQDSRKSINPLRILTTFIIHSAISPHSYSVDSPLLKEVQFAILCNNFVTLCFLKNISLLVSLVSSSQIVLKIVAIRCLLNSYFNYLTPFILTNHKHMELNRSTSKQLQNTTRSSIYIACNQTKTQFSHFEANKIEKERAF